MPLDAVAFDGDPLRPTTRARCAAGEPSASDEHVFVPDAGGRVAHIQ